MTDQEIYALLLHLTLSNRLVATVDVDGEPFHWVTNTTKRSIGNEFILWLEPQGVDDDLTTPLAALRDRTDEE